MTNVDRLKALYLYDPETGAFVSTSARKRWAQGRVAGTADKYTMIFIDGKKYRAHRLAWLYMTGEWPHGQIDHLNGDKHDNRFANLRVATSAQNSQNIWCPRRDCGSGFKGVSWRERNHKWHATIRVNGKAKHLGYFESAEAAHAAYVLAKQQHHDVARSL